MFFQPDLLLMNIYKVQRNSAMRHKFAATTRLVPLAYQRSDIGLP
jgi:hypothetical protein